MGEVIIEVFNFGNRLEEWQISQIRQSIEDYSRLRNNQVFEEVHHILIDNEQPINSLDGEKQNGSGSNKDGAIKSYPQALKQVPHRVPGVPNLEGTVIHELSHSLGIDFEIKWSKEFGWSQLDTPEPLPGGTELRRYINTESERCVTDYAKINAAEDICESIVAALRNPQVLDLERYDRLQKDLFPTTVTKEKLPVSTKTEGANAKLPEIVSPVK